MSQVWEHAPYTAGSLLVLLALADWANDDGIAWPSMERLAKKARIDRRSAQRIVRQLEKDGTLEIERGGGRAKQHKYLLKIETATLCRPLDVKENSDISDIERAAFDAQRATSDAETATPTSPDPLVEPSEEPSIEPPYIGRDFLHALLLFKDHRKSIRKPLSLDAERLLYRKLGAWGEKGATVALEDAVMNRWQGVFEPRQDRIVKHLNGSPLPPPKVELPPLPEGVAQWACGCGFEVLQNGGGRKDCPDCGSDLVKVMMDNVRAGLSGNGHG